MSQVNPRSTLREPTKIPPNINEKKSLSKTGPTLRSSFVSIITIIIIVNDTLAPSHTLIVLGEYK